VKHGGALVFRVIAAGLALAASPLIVLPAVAADAEPADADSIESLRKDVEELKREVREAREWRQTDSMAHLAGYAAVSYAKPENDTGTFAGTTFNPIFHYAYKDWLLLDAELEIELEDDGETEFALEYMTMDLVLNDSMVLLAGKLLSPIGMFRRNLHPAWINKLPSVPAGFDHGQAIPLGDVGVQLTGGIPLGNMRANYSIYTGNGPMLELDSGLTEIEQIGTEGLGSDNNGNKSVGGRIGLLPLPRLEIGASAVTATASDDMGMGLKRDYDVLDADFSWQVAGLDVRGEWAKTTLGADAASTISPEEMEWQAWYAQAAWRFSATKFEAVLRHGQYEPPSGVKTRQWAPGVNYLFASHVVAKLAYEFNDTDGVEDDDRALLQLAYGF
jgi:hypothetical protein